MVTTKLILLSILGVMTILLGSVALTLTAILNQRKSQLHKHGTRVKEAKERKSNKIPKSVKSKPSVRYLVSLFHPERDLNRHRTVAPEPTSVQAAADSHLHQSIQLFQKTNTYPLGDAGPSLYSNYGIDVPFRSGFEHEGKLDAFISKWNRLGSFMHDLLFNRKRKSKKESSFHNSNSTNTYSSKRQSSVIAPYDAYRHLEKSAQNGNPHAQHLLANVLASSIFLPSNINHLHDKNLSIPTDYSSSPALSLVLWHYAAISGHFESQMALGYRYYQAFQKKTKYTGPIEAAVPGPILGEGEYGLEHATCETALAYYEEAAHMMMDELERGIWRGKVKPAEDGHILSEIYFAGGSSVFLSQNNKPDELEDALEYFRIRASPTQPNPFGQPQPPDIQAALNLASFHHYGRRGVKQDLTTALHYYEIAADGGSREAAGMAGKFHLLGIGYEGDEMLFHHPFGLNDDISYYRFLGNTEKALKYLELGAPGGLDACDTKLQKKSDTIPACDPEALNGLGLAHLIGIPDKVKININRATQYFVLARDTGCTDASFHLGMVRLGWWSIDAMYESDEKGISSRDELNKRKDSIKKMKSERKNSKEKSKAESAFFPIWGDRSDDPEFMKMAKGEKRKKNVQMGIAELTKAANKGHIQAVHRLAMINSHGIPLIPMKYNQDHKSQTSTSTSPSSQNEKYIIKNNCPTAVQLFKHVLEAAPITNQRIRRAYKQFIAGDKLGALKNYMAAAETGSLPGMMNAAWILERHCPLPDEDNWKCQRASLRYWIEAGRLGNPDAIVNIGDHYYYSKFKQSPSKQLHVPLNGQARFVEEFQKIFNFILFPELLWRDGKAWLIRQIKQNILQKKRKKVKVNSDSQPTCSSDQDQTCESPFTQKTDDYTGDNKDKTKGMNENSQMDNLKIAASYYQRASKEYQSHRANFNLGFMHQWGIGLTQDFPLAKRHYDLAESMNPIAVQLALYGMRIHEKLVRWHWESINDGSFGKFSVIWSHFLSWETGIIVVLSLILQRLLRKRRGRR